jgi:hypothetical protein
MERSLDFPSTYHRADRDAKHGRLCPKNGPTCRILAMAADHPRSDRIWCSPLSAGPIATTLKINAHRLNFVDHCPLLSASSQAFSSHAAAVSLSNALWNA